MKKRERRYIYSKNYANWYKKINIFKYLSIILITLFSLSVPTIIKKLIIIDVIECVSQFGDCDQAMNDRLQSKGNYKDTKKIIEQQLKQNIQVNSYLIQYKIPSTIKIDLVLKKPKYAIRDLSSNFYLVDKEGLVLEITSQTNLPFLLKNTVYSPGQILSDKDIFSLRLLEKIVLINTISFAEIKSETLEIKIDNGILVKLPLEGDVDALAGSLRLIFSRLNQSDQGIRMKDISEIDLRFKNPVLR